MSAGKIQYAVIDGTYVLKFMGDVRLTLCSTLDAFAVQMFADEQFAQVIIDLSEADNIDSTSLGLLAKISIHSQKRFHCKPTIISPREDITRILLSMGFDQVFNLVAELSALSEGLEELRCEGCNEDQAREKVLEAHRILMSLNEKNRLAFQDLVRALEVDTHNSL